MACRLLHNSIEKKITNKNLEWENYVIILIGLARRILYVTVLDEHYRFEISVSNLMLYNIYLIFVLIINLSYRISYIQKHVFSSNNF